jgi:hypothetical protein
MDGEPGPTGLDVHVTACPACTAHAERLERIRLALRYETVGEIPDIASRVTASLPARRRLRLARLLPLAAAFTAGAVAGASFVGFGRHRPATVAVAHIADDVLRAQRTISSLEADVRVVEHGWHLRVPERAFTGSLRYTAPERVWLHLDDRTHYPSAAWVRGPVDLVVDGSVAWWRGPAACPREALPTCTPRDPRVQVITGREPFSEAAPAPLDLIVPVRSLAGPSSAERLGVRRIDGRDAIGVAVTAAQAAPLLSGLRRAGNWRDLQATERVELWLDRDALVPLEVRVPGRFDMTLSAVRTNGSPPAPFPATPAAPVVRDAGFRDGAAGIRTTAPDGMRPSVSGTIATDGGPAVSVATWTDGRAWLRVRETRSWPGGRLFGDLGDAVRRVPLGTGIAYASADGRKVAVHARDADAVVDGSVAVSALVRAAAGLGLEAVPVPSGWREASATADLSGLLVARSLPGFDAPAVRRDGATATIAYAGAGERWLVVDQAPGGALAPPLDPDARGVRVRHRPGRYSPGRAELEWVEGGIVVTMRGHGLTLPELLAIAHLLKAP